MLETQQRHFATEDAVETIEAAGSQDQSAKTPARALELTDLRDGFRAREVDATPLTAVVIGISSPALLCGLESVVQGTSGLRLIGSAGTFSAFVEKCTSAGKCIALADPFLGGGSIKGFMESLKGLAPRAQLLLMTEEYQTHIVRKAMKAGARGVVGKSSDMAEIRTALSSVAQGGRYFSPLIAARLAESLTLDELTPREMQVLEFLSKGVCNKTIARGLDVAVGTIKTHVCAIMCKLQAHSRTDAVLRASRVGLIQLV
jgi:DNA-binding NarL/FixJ family response regulator